ETGAAAGREKKRDGSQAANVLAATPDGARGRLPRGIRSGCGLDGHDQGLRLPRHHVQGGVRRHDCQNRYQQARAAQRLPTDNGQRDEKSDGLGPGRQ
ncbi:unnamed protein product, partial [Ectocarpus fasciculatus]